MIIIAGHVVELAGLTKHFGSTIAVEDLTVRLEPGRVVGLLGLNGAGKTTTLRMLTGLVEPTAGNATIGGRRYGEWDLPATVAGVLLDAECFHPQRSAQNHLLFVARLAGLPVDRIPEVLELVGLSAAARRRVGRFSTGMRQRLALAVTLLGDPPVLLLDEPVNGLDPDGIRWLRGFLRQHADGGGLVVVSSHLLAEVAQVADEIVVMDRGHLVADVPTDKLVRGAGAAVLVRSPTRPRLQEVLTAAGLQCRVDGDALIVDNVTPDQVGRIAAASHVSVTELATQAAGLEDAFLDLVTAARAGSS